MIEAILEIIIVGFIYFGLLYFFFDFIYKKLINPNYVLNWNKYVFYFFLGICFHILGEVTKLNKKYVEMNINKDLSNKFNMIKETVIVGAFYAFIFPILEYYFFNEKFMLDRTITIFVIASIIHIIGEYNGVNKWYYNWYNTINRL